MIKPVPVWPMCQAHVRELGLGDYFVPSYPPMSAHTEIQGCELQSLLSQPLSESSLGLYVHIPFCLNKCDFCNNVSYTGAQDDVVHAYVDAIAKEAALYGNHSAIRGRTVLCVYFGGGTPSMLSVDQLTRLIDGMQTAIPWKGVKEVSFECAPRSVRAHFLESLVTHGVTRLSIGVQSFNNLLLKLNGRIHYAEDILRAYHTVRAIGFNSVNVDLMVGLLGETEVEWRDTVHRVLELNPDSVTVYQTEVGHDSQLFRDSTENRLPTPLVSWEQKHARAAYAFSELEKAGYTVVSGYTAVKDPVKHRFLYEDQLWRNGDILGLGLSSLGYLNGIHYQNAVTLESYESGLCQGNLPLKRANALTETDRFVREFILQLKLGTVSLQKLREKFNLDPFRAFSNPLESLESEGYLTVSKSEVRLTRNGLVRLDRLLSRFFYPEV